MRHDEHAEQLDDPAKMVRCFMLFGKLFGFEVRNYLDAPMWNVSFKGSNRQPKLTLKVQP